MSKKDEVTRKVRNYKMTKMKGICEFNAYNRARTKTQSHVKSTNTKMLTWKEKQNHSTRINKHANFSDKCPVPWKVYDILLIILILFLSHYDLWNVTSASLKASIHSDRCWVFLLLPLFPTILRSACMSSNHLNFGLPTFLLTSSLTTIATWEIYYFHFSLNDPGIQVLYSGSLLI